MLKEAACFAFHIKWANPLERAVTVHYHNYRESLLIAAATYEMKSSMIKWNRLLFFSSFSTNTQLKKIHVRALNTEKNTPGVVACDFCDETNTQAFKDLAVLFANVKTLGRIHLAQLGNLEIVLQF